MNVLKDDLLGCNALIFDPQEHIEVLEGDMNTSKIQLESLILESECSKSTTRESSHKVLVLGIESTKLVPVGQILRHCILTNHRFKGRQRHK